MITRFQGESRKDSIINHLSLDIDEEIKFFEYLTEMGYSEDSEDEIIESMHEMFLQKEGY